MISVITVTRIKGRESSLLRCVSSVALQDYSGEVEYILVIDEEKLDSHFGGKLYAHNPRLRVVEVNTSRYTADFQPFYSVSRIGFLRNIGIEHCNGTYIGYLDDDNAFCANHLSSLAALLESNSETDIAYSWRYLFWADGSPFVQDRYPWTPNARLAHSKERLSEHIYNELVAAGIRIAGRNLQRDTVLTIGGEPVYTVDTSEMLVRANVHESHKWVTRFTWREMVSDYSDDYAFVKNCHESGVLFACSGQATLEYYFGGVSNSSYI